MFPAAAQTPTGPIATAVEFPDICASFALQGPPLRCSLTPVIFARGPCWNESASSSGDREGESQSQHCEADKGEPEWRILFTSDSGTEQEEEQKQELNLEESEK